MQKEGVLKWVSRGRPCVIARVLLKPMTAGEIWREARRFNPRIQLRDVCSLLRRFMEKGLVYCLAYERAKGSIFFWTEIGREIMSLSGVSGHVPANVDWNAYSFVARAKIRRLIVRELSRPYQRQMGVTAEEIRQAINGPQAFWLFSITRALKGLETHGIVECAGRTEIGRRKIYCLTDKGNWIAQQWLGPPAVPGEHVSDRKAKGLNMRDTHIPMKTNW